jgi:hypothetical protein
MVYVVYKPFLGPFLWDFYQVWFCVLLSWTNKLQMKKSITLLFFFLLLLLQLSIPMDL